ncbi:MAG: hypothetical protein B0D92_03935 [Spirochaeta sp. LUC14_002_19_P3]|nr:MAG: hypothetical protein B0D92_03935 [Spirochaeta sp. LUC14_002_19_P3]
MRVYLALLLLFIGFAVAARPAGEYQRRGMEQALLPSGEEAADIGIYHERTMAMLGEERHAEALDRFEWFFSHALDYDSSLSGVRSSYFLSDWMEFGAIYPPALERLRAIRNELASQVIHSRGNIDQFGDVVDINWRLGEEEKTIALFERLMDEQPLLAPEYWLACEELFFRYKRYDVVKIFVPNPLEEFKNQLNVNAEIIALIRTSLAGDNAEREGNEGFLVYLTMDVMNYIKRMMDYAMETGNTAAAYAMTDALYNVMK